MEKILVSGHSGFIGKNLVEKLEKEFEVIGISKNKAEMKIPQITKEISKISEKDVTQNISTIIHLAAISDAKSWQENPKMCFSTNVEGTKKMLEIARKKDTNFIFISSSHVYGIPEKIPVKEKDETNPISNYGKSKLDGEILCKKFHEKYGLNISILRLFSIYGKNSPNHLITSKIFNQLKNDEVITCGSLNSKRDFIHVSDVISSIKFVMKKQERFDIFNIGTGKSYSVLDICDMLEKITKKK
jgi:nucleoside-diphosphate-sugar epimerase